MGSLDLKNQRPTLHKILNAEGLKIIYRGMMRSKNSKEKKMIKIIQNQISWYRNTTPHNRKVVWRRAILITIAVALASFVSFVIFSRMVADIKAHMAYIEKAKQRCWESADYG